jgi:hypothetical protein
VKYRRNSMKPKYGAIFHPAKWPAVKLMVIHPLSANEKPYHNSILVALPKDDSPWTDGWEIGQFANVSFDGDITKEGWEWDE